MEIDGPKEERVSYNQFLPAPITNTKDSPADSHVRDKWNETERSSKRKETNPQTESDRPSKTKSNRYNLRANPAPILFRDCLVNQIESAKAQMRQQFNH